MESSGSLAEKPCSASIYMTALESNECERPKIEILWHRCCVRTVASEGLDASFHFHLLCGGGKKKKILLLFLFLLGERSENGLKARARPRQGPGIAQARPTEKNGRGRIRCPLRFGHGGGGGRGGREKKG